MWLAEQANVPLGRLKLRVQVFLGGVQLFGDRLAACVLHASGVDMQVGVYLYDTWLKFREGESQPTSEAGESPLSRPIHQRSYVHKTLIN